MFWTSNIAVNLVKGSENGSPLRGIQPPSGRVLVHIMQHKTKRWRKVLQCVVFGKALIAIQKLVTTFVHSFEIILNPLPLFLFAWVYR